MNKQRTKGELTIFHYPTDPAIRYVLSHDRVG